MPCVRNNVSRIARNNLKSNSLRGRCGDDQVGARALGLGQDGGPRAVDLEPERAAVRQAGTPAASGQLGGTGAGRESRWSAPLCGYVEQISPKVLCGKGFAVQLHITEYLT